MNVTFFPSFLRGYVGGVPSKSYLHRLLFCAALSEGETKINLPGSGQAILSDDINATINALTVFGKSAKIDDGSIEIFDCETRGREVFVNESGTTFRFLLPLLSAFTKDEIIINGSPSLAARPLSPLYEQLIRNGTALSQRGVFPMKVSGPLKSGVYSLPGDISSQFISGLLLALPLCGGVSEIIIEGALQSRPYVDMTLECLKLFNVNIEQMPGGYSIQGGQKYLSPGEIACESDFSNAAFFLAAGVLSNDFVGVSGLNPGSVQGDRSIIELLERFGGTKKISAGAVGFKKRQLAPLTIDVSDIPDLLPVLSLVAALSGGRTILTGAKRLRYKESDRLLSTSALINGLGGKVAEKEDGLVIDGVPALSGGLVSSFNDHRIAMTAAVASCASETPVRVENFGAVNKSYPSFLSDFEKIGGKFVVN